MREEMGLYLRGVAPFPSPSALNTLDGKLYHEDFNGCARPRAPSRLHPYVLPRGRSLLRGYTLTEKGGSRSFLHRLTEKSIKKMQGVRVTALFYGLVYTQLARSG